MGIEKYLNKKIMVVDDLVNMRLDLIKILKDLGFTNIKEMADGKLAWDELKLEAQYGNPYEIIFTDINMPIMNGLELLKAMRGMNSYKKTPIFIVSTENEKNIIIGAVLEGATDYILKPYNSKVIVEKLVLRLK